MQKDGLEFGRDHVKTEVNIACYLIYVFVNVTPTCSRTEHLVSLFSVRRSDRRRKYAVGLFILLRYVNDAISFDRHF